MYICIPLTTDIYSIVCYITVTVAIMECKISEQETNDI